MSPHAREVLAEAWALWGDVPARLRPRTLGRCFNAHVESAFAWTVGATVSFLALLAAVPLVPGVFATWAAWPAAMSALFLFFHIPCACTAAGALLCAQRIAAFARTRTGSLCRRCRRRREREEEQRGDEEEEEEREAANAFLAAFDDAVHEVRPSSLERKLELDRDGGPPASCKLVSTVLFLCAGTAVAVGREMVVKLSGSGSGATRVASFLVGGAFGFMFPLFSIYALDALVSLAQKAFFRRRLALDLFGSRVGEESEEESATSPEAS